MKKNKSKLYLSVMTCVLLIASSCNEDYLNPVSQTALSDASVFDTPAKIEAQVLGIYAAAKSGKFLGGRYYIYNDVRAENYLSNDGNGITARYAWEHTEGAGFAEPLDLWNAAYTSINRANLFLDGMEAKGNSVAGDKALGYQGEAKFMRALCYYSLLQFFAQPYVKDNGASPGLPLRLVGINSPGSNDLARSTVAQVYQQIIADLDFAEQNLPATPASAGIRAHKNAAIALKTRVYLSMANYPKVVEEANKIVSASGPFVAATGVLHGLEANISTVFGGSYVGKEVILTMPFTNNDAPGTQNQIGAYYRYNGDAGAAGIFYLNPDGITGDPSWIATDARRGFIKVNASKEWFSKWATGTPWVDYIPVMRYSEVLLNLAEGIARTTAGVDTRALALVNAVRQRSDATTTLAPANNEELIDDILRERNIELLGEGIRSIDIYRLKLAFPAKEIVGGAEVAAVPTNSPSYIWPIPSNELLYNKLMTQN